MGGGGLTSGAYYVFLGTRLHPPVFPWEPDVPVAPKYQTHRLPNFFRRVPCGSPKPAEKRPFIFHLLFPRVTILIKNDLYNILAFLSLLSIVGHLPFPCMTDFLEKALQSILSNRDLEVYLTPCLAQRTQKGASPVSQGRRFGVDRQ